MQISQQQLRSKFKELDSENSGILDINQIKQVFVHFDCDLPQQRLTKMIEKLYFYNKMSTMNLFDSKNDEKGEQKKNEKVLTNQQIPSEAVQNDLVAAQEQKIQSGQEVQQQESKQPLKINQIPQIESYSLTLDQLLKVSNFVTNPIDWELFKLITSLLQAQYRVYQITTTKVKTTFALKDPAPQFKLNITIGQQLTEYNSKLYAKLVKMPAQVKQQQISLRLSMKFPFSETITLLSSSWQQLYAFIKQTLMAEMPMIKDFFQSFKVTTEVLQNEFILKIVNNNPLLTQLLYTFCKFGDIALKTILKIKLQLLFSFNFDLGQFIKNADCALQDFMMKNVRLQFKGQTSQIMTSLKEIVVAANMLSGLSSVHDDEESLWHIFMLNFHSLNLNLKFKNQIFQDKEQQTLFALLMVVKQASVQLSQAMTSFPGLSQLLKNLLKCNVNLQLKAYDFKVNANLNIKNLDKFIFDTSEVMKKFMDQS